VSQKSRRHQLTQSILCVCVCVCVCEAESSSGNSRCSRPHHKHDLQSERLGFCIPTMRSPRGSKTHFMHPGLTPARSAVARQNRTAYSFFVKVTSPMIVCTKNPPAAPAFFFLRLPLFSPTSHAQRREKKEAIFNRMKDF